MKDSFYQPMRGLSLILLLLMVSSTNSRAAMTEKDWKSAEELFGLVQNDFCKNESSEICRHFKAFRAGSVPVFPEGKYLTVGRYVLGSDQPVEDRLFTFLSKKRNGQLQVSGTFLKPSNPQEKIDGLQFIEQIKQGKRDPKNSTQVYLQQAIDTLPLVAPEKSHNFLFYEAPEWLGPILIRENNRTLYVFGLRMAPKFSGSFDRVPTALFAYLPR